MVSVYNRSRATREILKVLEKEPPSLTVHLYQDHWRFNQSGNCLYHTPIASLLEDIRAQRVPVDFLDIFKQSKVPFYNGCLIVELFDHRDVLKSSDAPEAQHIVLWPTAETMWADICLMNAKDGGKWTDLDALNYEAKMLLQTSPDLYLDPDPLISKIANAALRVSAPPLPAPFKRKRAADETEREEEQKARRDRMMKLMNPRADRVFHAQFRVLDTIQRRDNPEIKPSYSMPAAPMGSQTPSMVVSSNSPTPDNDPRKTGKVAIKQGSAANSPANSALADDSRKRLLTTAPAAAAQAKKRTSILGKAATGTAESSMNVSPMPPPASLPPSVQQSAATAKKGGPKKTGTTPNGVGKPSEPPAPPPATVQNGQAQKSVQPPPAAQTPNQRNVNGFTAPNPSGTGQMTPNTNNQMNGIAPNGVTRQPQPSQHQPHRPQPQQMQPYPFQYNPQSHNIMQAMAQQAQANSNGNTASPRAMLPNQGNHIAHLQQQAQQARNNTPSSQPPQGQPQQPQFPNNGQRYIPSGAMPMPMLVNGQQPQGLNIPMNVQMMQNFNPAMVAAAAAALNNSNVNVNRGHAPSPRTGPGAQGTMQGQQPLHVTPNMNGRPLPHGQQPQQHQPQARMPSQQSAQPQSQQPPHHIQPAPTPQQQQHMQQMGIHPTMHPNAAHPGYAHAQGFVFNQLQHMNPNLSMDAIRAIQNQHAAHAANMNRTGAQGQPSHPPIGPNGQFTLANPPGFPNWRAARPAQANGQLMPQQQQQPPQQTQQAQAQAARAPAANATRNGR